MINRKLGNISAVDIDSLITNSISENVTLEFKQQLNLSSDNEKREFLADLSALANTSGGDLVFGIQEAEGIAKAIKPLDASILDTELLRINSVVTSGLEPRIRYASRVVETDSGPVLVLRVEKSSNSPHRVILKGHDKFYGRTSAGKYPLDVQELRRAFTDSIGLTQRLRAFRSERIAEIIADETGLPLGSGPKLILHLISVDALTSEVRYDLPPEYIILNKLRPLSVGGWSTRLTLEGTMTHGSVGQNHYSYTHLYRSGIIEAVETDILTYTHQNGVQNLPSVGFEGLVVGCLPNYLEALRVMGAQPPILVGLSLTGVKGAVLGRNYYRLSFGQNTPVLQRNLILPEVLLTDFTEDPIRAIRPVLDSVWNACGEPRSANFDADGTWTPRS